MIITNYKARWVSDGWLVTQGPEAVASGLKSREAVYRAVLDDAEKKELVRLHKVYKKSLNRTTYACLAGIIGRERIRDTEFIGGPK